MRQSLLRVVQVLLTAQYKVKIADFGLARDKRKTATRGVGTPAYMPPEMFDESQETLVKPLALDVYALGIIMWQLWFKTRPYKGKGTAAIITHVNRGKRPAFKAADLGIAPPAALQVRSY